MTKFFSSYLLNFIYMLIYFCNYDNNSLKKLSHFDNI